MKNTCKIVSALLSVVFVLTVATPVFAEEKQSTVSYDVPESFSWNIPASFEIGESMTITCSPSNLLSGSSIKISLTGSANGTYDDFYEKYRFRVKADNRSDNQYAYYKILSQLHPDYPDESGALYIEEQLPFTLIDTSLKDDYMEYLSFYWDEGAPTLAGTYTDTLTFAAELHSVND